MPNGKISDDLQRISRLRKDNSMPDRESSLIIISRATIEIAYQIAMLRGV